MNPTPEQRLAIETQDRAMVVEAGAGTGKTWVLVQRFMHLLEAHPDWALESIIAITFTEKAAREMRTRLRQAIEEKAREKSNNPYWQDHRLNLDRLNVSTIHSLCARILRENAIAAGIDPLFQVLDEQESEILKEEAIRETIQALDGEGHPALELLASLRIFDLQTEMESMLEKRGTLFKLFTNLPEPAEMTARWQVGLEEMQIEIWNEQLQEETRLNEALTTLPEVPISDPEDRLAGSVLSAQQGCLELAQGDLTNAATRWLQINLVGGKKDNWGGKEELVELKQLLGIVRDAARELEKKGALQEVGEADEIAAEHLHLWRSLWERLEQTYSQIKEKQAALDFDDLELLTDRLLHKTPPPHRLEGFLNSIHHLMVDEFQDTNLIQQRIVYALAPLDQPGKLFVVGDAKQSIYRFRQAQVSIFNQTAEHVKEVTGQPPISLSTSFRTHQMLVEVANNLFEKILSPLGKSYEDYEAQSGSLMANRKAHPELPNPVEILLLPAKDIEDENISIEDARIWEAQWLAQRLLALKESEFQVWDKQQEQYRAFEYRDAAVLFRATTQMPLYEAEFKKAGLPYLTVSGRGYYDRPEVQDLIALLAALANPNDDLNLAAVLRSPLFSFSDETLYRLRWHAPDDRRSTEPISYRLALAQPPTNEQLELVQRANSILSELWSLANRVDVWTILRQALDLTSYEAVLAKFDGQTGRQHANVQKFLTLTRQHGQVSLSEFLRRLRDLKTREAREGEALGKEPESGAVHLMSIHASKGLEYPVIVVADMGREKRAGFGSPYLLHDPAFGLLCKVRDELGDWVKPAGYAWGEWLHNRMEEAERRRLLYVACTRAADLLILSGQVGRKDTWLSNVQVAWEIGVDGSQEETIGFSDLSIKVFRPSEPLELDEYTGERARENIGIENVPILAQPLPPQEQQKSIAVTRLGQLLSRQENDRVEFRPAMWNSERPKRTKRAPGFLVGNIVHMALAHWDCLEFSESQRLDLLENYARREGAFSDALVDAIHRSNKMLTDLREHSIYEKISQAQQRFPEVPFSLNTPTGLLHGIIDLLYQDQDESWHLIDWKTEWAPQAKIEEIVQEHMLQMAIYTKATEQSLEIHADAALCFMVPNIKIHQIAATKLDTVWSDVSGLSHKKVYSPQQKPRPE